MSRASILPTAIPNDVSRQPPSSTVELAGTPLWQIRPEFLSIEEREQLSYMRAESLAKHYELTTDDVLHLSERYWRFHSDPILGLDGAAATLLTIHYNLCLGTIASYLSKRPDLRAVADKLVKFEWNGQYCLTELGHGLDIINMETQATLLPDGSFEIHTPSEQAAKFMPPTAPSGYPCIAIVHARLYVDGDDRGPKVFLVKLHDGKRMEHGVVAKALAPRGSARPVKHCLTYFNHVHVPASALLSDLEKSSAPRDEFFNNISRVITGTLSMGVLGVSAMRVASYVAASYSLRRHVINSATKSPTPIISFSTQYTPVLSAIAHTLVLHEFANRCYEMFTGASDITTKHFIAAVMKCTIHRTASSYLVELGDRCGAQGLAEVNQITGLHAEMRGAAIAEGDILTIAIRFAIDLLRGRVSAPRYQHPNSVLARHERSLISDLQKSLACHHQEGSVDTAVLPLCLTLLEAIGSRVAYDAAHGVLSQEILDLFVASTIRKNAAWYAMNEGMDYATQARKEVEAAKALLPRMASLLDMLDVKAYAVAPIVSDNNWSRYMQTLKEYGREPSDSKVPTLGNSTNSLAHNMLLFSKL